MHQSKSDLLEPGATDSLIVPGAPRWRPRLVPVGSDPRWSLEAVADQPQERLLLPSRRSAVRQLMLAAADMIALVLATLVARVFTGGWGAAVVLLGSFPVWLTVAKAHGLYDADESKAWHLTTDELPRIFYSVTVSLTLTWMIMSFAGVEGLDAPGALAVWSVALATTTILRTSARGAWRRFVPSERSVVVGVGASASRVIRKLQLERGHHMTVRAQIPHTGIPTAESLRAMVKAQCAHRVIVAVDELDDPSLTELYVVCREEGVKLSVVPPMQSVLKSASRVHHVAELPMVELPTAGPSPLAVTTKRAMDIVISGAMLIAVAPLFVVVALAVRCTSPGGALFRQARGGRGGEPFTMLKFRSMCADAEDRLKDVVDLDALDDPMFKIKSDPRVTKVGRLLRATSLDELPQLWNVLRGDMSLVGPRPEEMQVVDRYDAEARSIRLAMRPGLTGPMQIHGRGELTFDERLAVERDYVEHYGLMRDLRILARTVSVVLFQQGAF